MTAVSESSSAPSASSASPAPNAADSVVTPCPHATSHRSHTCGELRPSHVGQTVTLTGWAANIRDYTSQDKGGLLFIDLRDRYGLTQVVLHGGPSDPLIAMARAVQKESVLSVVGEVRPRDPKLVNAKLDTGAVELAATAVRVLNAAEVTPFPVNDWTNLNEDMRLKYRYLDLRRPAMQANIQARYRLIRAIRRYMDGQGFIDVETPTLLKSSPEGAREFLVPCRLAPGEFYALAQSPQQLKQMLMVAGFDRYYQIARCYRDEDLRANRQPEFTQLDLEMSFVDREDVLRLMEGCMAAVCTEMNIPFNGDAEGRLPRMGYDEAMRRFGSDKPDLRYGMEIVDFGDIVPGTEFKAFKDALAAGAVARGLCVPGGGRLSRKEQDELVAFVKGELGGKGVAPVKIEAGKMAGNIGKLFGDGPSAAMVRRFAAVDGDMLLLVADAPAVACKILDALRRRMAREFKLIPPGSFHFSWVVDFPLVEFDPEEKRWIACHHPFTSARREDLERLESDPGSVRARAYDLVCNGEEIGGGSIRIHDPAEQARQFRMLGISEEDAQKKFGFMLEAFRYGAPPHGGIALGLDRITMLFTGQESIRDVIAFPKTQKGQDLMLSAPSPVEDKQLRDAGLQLRTAAKK